MVLGKEEIVRIAYKCASISSGIGIDEQIPQKFYVMYDWIRSFPELHSLQDHHEKWSHMALMKGYRWGKEECTIQKTSPYLTTYALIPEETRLRYGVFLAVVRAFLYS